MARTFPRASAIPRVRSLMLAGRLTPLILAWSCLGATAEELPQPDAARDDAAAARRVIDEALGRGPAPDAPRQPPAATGEVAPDLLLARISAEVAAKQLEAKRLGQKSPAEALALLDEAAAGVSAQPIPAEKKDQLLRRIERARRDIEETSGKRRAELALEKRNAEVEGQIDRERSRRVEVDQRIAMLVDEYNTLIDQRRFAEAEAVAKKAGQLAPDNAVVRQLLAQSRVIRRMETQRTITGDQQTGFLDVADDVAASATPFTGPIEFPETRNWQDLTKNRQQRLAEGRSRASPAELEIHRKLETRVKTAYRDQPLAVVLDSLAKQAGVPIHLDMVGLEQEAVASDTPVTLSLDGQQISLKSALKLLLEPLHLRSIVQDEVLKVTSPRAVKGVYYSVTYQVGDLVKPIPNFSSEGLGIESALSKGYSQALRNSLAVQVEPPTDALNRAARAGSGAAVDAASLAQLQGRGGPPASGSMPMIPFGPPAVGGGQADFQSLIDLIQNTVGGPGAWADGGGNGAIRPFDTNLSLVVSQTQEVHEEIADLLEQLRRLQDLQVTIEVRFISLADYFFERIGVDFDFDIDDNVTQLPEDDSGPSVTIGLDPQGNPTSDLDLSFTQGSFGSTIPAFGGFAAGDAANFGFAILSDIEAFFVIEAAQGDTRTNVLQAPKVTLFNGQQASVNDSSQRPFVTSVVPVVGDFAAAQAPIIVVLSEGTSLNVQAVVSNDRRFVRLTLVPFFSKIGDVETFTFEGRRTSKSGTAVVDPTDDEQTVNNDSEEIVEGTTVQLPQFAFTSVSTTVSVPDGGTILLGGIKRLSEGRNEKGVPILSKVPYINRLFKNVGIGRSTQSLMMMVTPRIIIQEEEDERVLGTPTGG